MSHKIAHRIPLDDPPVSIGAVAHDELTLRRIEAALVSAGLGCTVATTDVEAIAEGDAPDVLVIGCPRGVSSRDAMLERLHRRLRATSLVVVGPADSRASVRAAIEAGADGLVFEAELEHALGPTVAAVAAGQIVVPADHRRDIDPPTLSAREKQILGLVVMGLSNKEISAQLFLAQSTVKCHLSSIFQKLGVRSRHEAAQLVLDPQHKLGLGILGLSSTSYR